MSNHIHSWRPIEGEVAKYSCECGETGYRHRDGWVRPHKSRIARTSKADVRVRGVERVPSGIRDDWDGGKDRDS